MQCPKCERDLPTKEQLTKNGCVWCDGQYHHNKEKENEK